MSNSESQQEERKGREIPIRRVVLNDVTQLPSEYSTTPGGTFFSTTPGGTRIVYDRSFLLKCRNSPLAKSPPANMVHIPGITSPAKNVEENGDTQDDKDENDKSEKMAADDHQFQMDI